ncbi:MAG: 3',5'-cyclic-AMP phosphodiesterase [Pseudomonadota bacterium]
MIKIVQITDSHLGINHGETLLSMNPDESLVDVLTLIDHQQPDIDLLMATGDIANNPSLSAYQRFYTTVSDYLLAPMVWIPGNHDDHAMMEDIIPGSQHRLVLLGDWLIIMLDSHVPGEIHGNFSQLELGFLSDALIRYQDKHIVISFHHQPVPIGSQWMDRYIVQNAHVFWELISPYQNIKAVLWGHVHQEFDELYNGIRLLSSPSTCIQFAPNHKEFALEDSMPGYRWFELNDDGSFTTAVERVERKDYGVDFNSIGY